MIDLTWLDLNGIVSNVENGSKIDQKDTGPILAVSRSKKKCLNWLMPERRAGWD